MKKLLLPSLLVLALTGCPSTPEGTGDDLDKDGSGSKSGTSIPTVTPTPPGTGDIPDGLTNRSVFFDYDSYTIRADARSVIDDNAKFLARQPARKVTIQGNADERGSREYNLALGQKRAEAVRRALRLQGVNDTQMEAVSMGKERPRCSASTETCWAENRRGDFVYLR